jgi:hypothetical protein
MSEIPKHAGGFGPSQIVYDSPTPETPKHATEVGPGMFVANEGTSVFRQRAVQPAPAVPEGRGEPPRHVLSISESERRDPTPEDFADPRFDVIWRLIKRLDVDFGNGLRSGATGNDVCAILDRLNRVLAPDPSEALRALVEKWQNATQVRRALPFRGVEAPADADGWEALHPREEDVLKRCAYDLAALLPTKGPR